MLKIPKNVQMYDKVILFHADTDAEQLKTINKCISPSLLELLDMKQRSE